MEDFDVGMRNFAQIKFSACATIVIKNLVDQFVIEKLKIFSHQHTSVGNREDKVEKLSEDLSRLCL